MNYRHQAMLAYLRNGLNSDSEASLESESSDAESESSGNQNKSPEQVCNCTPIILSSGHAPNSSTSRVLTTSTEASTDTSNSAPQKTSTSANDCDDWKKSKAKAKLICELKNKDSQIFSYIEKDLSDANYKKIRELYGCESYQMKHFRPNFKRLLDNLRLQKGDFAPQKKSAESNGAPKWYISLTDQSDGYR